MSVYRAIGLRSGPSLEGIDAAILDTDGADEIAFGETLSLPFERAHKVFVRRAIKAASEGRDGAEDIKLATGAITRIHAHAVKALLEKAELRPTDIDVVGFDGQTILHRSPAAPGDIGRNWQLGDGAALAAQTGIDVVTDFRQADMEAGGMGAPLAPVYYAALARRLGRPHTVGVLKLDGVANITYAPPYAEEGGLVAFDCGPGKDLFDEWLALKGAGSMDGDGAGVSQGTVHDDVLRLMMLAPFLRQPPPKSLGHIRFKLDPVKALSVEDGAATIAAFVAASVDKAQNYLPDQPGEWIVVGRGRRNPLLMDALKGRLSAPVVKAEEAGWRGDALEAECFSYLAVRSLKGLPLSFPKTTRVPRPMLGGVHIKAPRD